VLPNQPPAAQAAFRPPSTPAIRRDVAPQGGGASAIPAFPCFPVSPTLYRSAAFHLVSPALYTLAGVRYPRLWCSRSWL
jgi:hypothetical protein